VLCCAVLCTVPPIPLSVALAMGASPGSGAVWSQGPTLLFLVLQGVLVMPISFTLFTVAARFLSAPEVSLFFLIGS
jgi:hypothetical protein